MSVGKWKTEPAASIAVPPKTSRSIIYLLESKGMMLWYHERGQFPSVMVLRRYLKLVYQHCVELGIMDQPWKEVDDSTFPFKLSEIPVSYPKCSELVLM